jgi:phytoene dehydrogenase-like protein
MTTTSFAVLCSQCEQRRQELVGQGWTYVSCNKAADQSGAPPGQQKCVLKVKRA